MLGHWSSTRKPHSHRLQDRSDRRENTQERERSSINQDRVVDEHLELPVPAVHHVDIRVQLSANACRHPGGKEAGDSVGAVSDRDSGH